MEDSVDRDPVNSKASMRTFVFDRLANLLQAGLSVTAFALLAGCLGRWHFMLDLASHFRVYYTVAMLLLGCLFIAMKRWRWGAFGLVAGLACAATLAPFFGRSSELKVHQLRLVAINVLSSNTQHQSVLDYLHATAPDIIILQEVNDRWAREIEAGLGDAWAYRQVTPRNDNFGIAMYSKIPWQSCDIVELVSPVSTPSLSAVFPIADVGSPDAGSLRVIAVHPLPPMNGRMWEARNAFFASLAKEVSRGDSSRTIVAGDLNCSPWSPFFRQLLNDSELSNSSLGHGLNPSWYPLSTRLIAIPIDHMLVGSGITVLGRSVGPFVGSDHRPVVIDL